MKRLVASTMMAAAVVGMLDVAPVLADPGGYIEPYVPPGGRYEVNEEDLVWKEAMGDLPAMPPADSLLEIGVVDASHNRYFLDAKSLSVGNDGVTRMTLVTEHRGGSRTVTYEGIRCETREYRLYAIGASGGWDTPKRSRWRPIPVTGYESVRSVLFEDHLCDSGAPRPAESVVQALRYPRASPN